MSVSTWILANGDNLQVVLFFSLLLVLGVAERLAPRRPGPLDRAVRWPTNVFLTIVNLVAMSALPVSFISASLWAEANGWGLLNQFRLPLTAWLLGSVAADHLSQERDVNVQVPS